MQTPTVTLPREFEYDGPEPIVFDVYDTDSISLNDTNYINCTNLLQKPLNGITIGIVEFSSIPPSWIEKTLIHFC